MSTIRDVAERAGVSIATVSRALAGHPHVNSETRQRVLEAVKALNYRPDQVARSLRRRRSNLIGFVVSTIENVFFTEAAHAAEQVARQRGYNLIVCNTDEDPEREKTYLEVLDRQLVAGIVLAPAPGDAGHLQPFLADGMPMVLINRRVDSLPCTSITSNDEEAAFQCVQHLIAQGRRRIAAITGLPDVFTTRARRQGYRRALAAAGLPLDGLEVCGWANLEGGYQATYQLMQRPDPPDALFVFNNVMTQGAIVALQELGITWPDPVDVAGFGAFKAARLYRPPLTLIAQPAREMGRLAAELLIGQVEEELDPTPQQIVLHNRLISRQEWLTERLGTWDATAVPEQSPPPPLPEA
ncbi:MAG: LacI family transcriptional regulator [Litorilinea sp.]|nr:MAG: LacI family transcriptional regulator [Litorilinea sp.]